MQFAHRIGHPRVARLGLRNALGIAALSKPWRQLVEHLVRGVLALAQRRQQIGRRGHAVFIGNAAQVWSLIWLIGTLNFLASRSSSLRPISTALARWSSLSQCLILLRARGLLTKREPVAARLVVFCVTISTMSPVRSFDRKGTMRPFTLAPTQVWPTSV